VFLLAVEVDAIEHRDNHSDRDDIPDGVIITNVVADVVCYREGMKGKLRVRLTAAERRLFDELADSLRARLLRDVLRDPHVTGGSAHASDANASSAHASDTDNDETVLDV